MGLFRRKNSGSSCDYPEFLCGNCGSELIQMGNLFKCENCDEISYLDEDGELISGIGGDEGENPDYSYGEVYGTSQWDDDND